jgi:hypothetical protein
MYRTRGKLHLVISILTLYSTTAFNSCWLAGPVYRSVDEPKRPGAVPKLITLENSTIKVFLWATAKKDTTTFDVHVDFDPLPNAGALTLSHIKVNLRCNPEKPEPFILQTIQLSRLDENGHRRLENISDPAKENISINASHSEACFLIYHFVNTSKRHRYHEMKVLLEADVSDGAHTTAIKQEMIFKRYFYVDIAGN